MYFTVKRTNGSERKKMAARKRKASDERDDIEFERRRLHCELKLELRQMVDPNLGGYDEILIRCGMFMSPVEIQLCKEKGLIEICDILERKGKFGIGDYGVLRRIFKDINEPAVDAIDNYQRKLDKLALKDEICLGVLKSWMEGDKTFCSTKATEYIHNQAKKQRKVLVCGVAGSGKSSNVHHIALKLKDQGYRIFLVQKVVEMVEMIDKLGEDKQVYVFDDVFGVHGVVEDKRRGWSDENKDTLEHCLKKPNVIILCTSRLTVLKDDKLSNIRTHFTIINISQDENELSKDERVEIFRKHATAKQRDDLLKNENQLTDKVKQKIKNIKCPLGCFPLVCRLFTGDKETKQKIEEYFSKPLKVIAENLDKLRTEEPIRHFCLLLCLIYDNKLPVNIITVGDESEETKKIRVELFELCELPVTTSRETIHKKMATLLQTFVKREGDTYRFVHDIIHDAVIKHVNNLSSSVHQGIMSHCSSKFMMDRVHLSGVVCKGRWGDPYHDTESCINIRHDSFTCWGVHVLDIVRDGVRTSDKLYDIHEGRCSRHDDRVYYNPWRDVFWYNRCVDSTEGQTAIAQALDRKSPSDVQTLMCTDGYSFYGDRYRHTALHWSIVCGLTHIVRQTLSMISTTRLRQLDSEDRYRHGLLWWAKRYTDIEQMVRQKLQEGQNVTKS